MTRKHTGSFGERQKAKDAETGGASDSVLLAAIQRGLRRVYADLLREAPPDHIASLIERLSGELEERKRRRFQGVSL